jgi:hypothetical protein
MGGPMLRSLPLLEPIITLNMSNDIFDDCKRANPAMNFV